MMRQAALATFAVLGSVACAACGDDPSLQVNVEHPAGYTVDTTIVSVYESDAFSCTGVEFGDITESELTAALVDEATFKAVQGSTDGLEGISRVDNKVIVARGYDSGGSFVTAGCVEKGVISGRDKVTITTEPTATVSVFGSGDVADPTGLAVTVTDPLVQSLAKRHVAWRVYGPAGTMPMVQTNITTGDAEWVPTKPPCTNDSGIVKLHPIPPSLISGFAMQVRASWSTEPNRIFTAFTNVDSFDSAMPLAAVPQTQRWCALRVNGGTRRLVCLADGGGGTQVAHDFEVTVSNGTAQLVDRQQQSFTGLGVAENVIALYGIDHAAARDVYALTNRARIIGVFSPSQPPANTNPRLGAGEAATDVIVMPACGTGADLEPQQLLLRVQTTTAMNQARTLHPLGAGLLANYGGTPALVPQPFTLNTAGCVTELQPGGIPNFRQVGVLDFGRNGGAATDKNITKVFFACGAGQCEISLPVPRSGVGFLPGEQPRMIGAFFDASGTVLSEWVLQPDKQRLDRLVELDRITAASFPLHIITGNFDGDSEPDLFWDIPNVNNATSNFQVSYARKIGNERLSALSGAVNDTFVIDTFVADVTGDGHDDLVVERVDKFPLPTAASVVVIPLHTSPPAFSPMLDTPCSQ